MGTGSRLAGALVRALRGVRGCSRGIALVEFAVTAPIMLLTVLAGLELANYALAHMRVSHIAMTVADNAGRVNTTIDEANIYEVFAGAEAIGRPIDFPAKGRVVLSSLEPNGKTGSTAGQWIRWQRCWGSLAVAPAYGRQGAGQNDATLAAGLGPTGNKIVSATGTAVMFVEVSYDYQPLFAGGFMRVGRIRYESAFNVRERLNQAITNTKSLTVNTCPA